MGKLIVFEGTDGSGKATQTELLYRYLAEKAFPVKKVEFPNYQSPSSGLIKMYLRGDFGAHPNDVSPYVASTFYAVDRFAGFKTEWGNFYNEGGLILADRYTTSNLIHQMSKIADPVDREKFAAWLVDLEYKKFQLPEPDCVIFLDVPPDISRALIAERAAAGGTREPRDIHETDQEYLTLSYQTSLRLAEKYGWLRIPCTEKGGLKDIDSIHRGICQAVKSYL